MPNESIAERRLIEETRRKLGASLTTFLLAGYSENKIVQSRFFYLSNAKQLNKQSKLVGMTTDDPAGLPFKKEPLVLAALLTLLKKRDDRIGINPAVPFPAEDIREVLKWENNDEINSIINSAIRKYFNLSYLRADDLSANFEGATSFTCHIYRLVVSYMFSSESELHPEVLRDDVEDMACVDVEFSQEMVEELRRRRFLRINWDSIISIEQAI